LHARIVGAIERSYPDRLIEHVERLAHHAARGELWEQAVTYFQESGTRAANRSAYYQAATSFEQALSALAALAETPDRRVRELSLQLALATALQMVRGFAAPEVERVYTRARLLCQETSDPVRRVPFLLGLRVFYQVRGQFQTALELGEQALFIAEQMQDLRHLTAAHHGLGHTLFSLGEFTAARAHGEQGILLNPRQQRWSPAVYGGIVNPGIHILGILAWSLWYLGYAEQALNRIQEALALAREVVHPAGLEQALASAAIVHQLRREPSAARACAAEALEISREHGFAFREALDTLLLGWATAAEGDEHKGVSLMVQGLAAYRATGAEAWRHYWLALLAETYAKAGRIEEGLEASAEGLATVQAKGERHYEAELNRIRGELVLASPGDNQAEAEVCFHRALDVARRQLAKSCELRAAASLGQLWSRQGKSVEARRLLVDVSSWFTEGFDTVDQQAARSLLEGLGAA